MIVYNLISIESGLFIKQCQSLSASVFYYECQSIFLLNGTRMEDFSYQTGKVV